jgi:hypothetical protein
MLACKALRSVAVHQPFADGCKAASDMFAPKKGAAPNKYLQELFNSVRSSGLWAELLDKYWAASLNDDKLAEPFQAAGHALNQALEGGDLDAAVTSVEALSKMQVVIEPKGCMPACPPA